MGLFGINKWHIETSLDMINAGITPEKIEAETREKLEDIKKWVEKELSEKNYSTKEYEDLLNKWLDAYKLKVQKDTQRKLEDARNNVGGKPNSDQNHVRIPEKDKTSNPQQLIETINKTVEGNKRFLDKNSTIINEILNKLNEKDSEEKELKTLLQGVLNNPDGINVIALQSYMINNWEGIKISGSGKPDGIFRGLTLGELKRVVLIEEKTTETIVNPNVNGTNNNIEKNNPLVIPVENNIPVAPNKKTEQNNVDKIEGFSIEVRNGEEKRESKNNIVIGTFDSNNRLYNGREILKGEKTMRVFENGKLKCTYEGEFKNGKFNGIVKYFDGTGRVDVWENGKVNPNYTLKYMAVIGALIGIDLAGLTGVGTIPSLALGTGYDLYDLTQTEDTGWQILKSIGWIDNRYYAGDKGFLEYSSNVLGLIPLGTTVTKGVVLAKYMKTLSPEELKEFNLLKETLTTSFTDALKKGKSGKVWNEKIELPKNTQVKEVGETSTSIAKKSDTAEVIQTPINLTRGLNSKFKKLFRQQLSGEKGSIEIGSIKIEKVKEGGEVRYLYKGVKYKESEVLKNIPDDQKVAFLRKNADETIGSIKGTQNVPLDGIPGFRNTRIVNGKIEKKVGGNWKILEGEELVKVKTKIFSNLATLEKLLNRHLPNFEIDTLTIRQKLIKSIKESGLGKQDEKFSKWIKERGWVSLSMPLQSYRGLSWALRNMGESMTKFLDIASAGNHAIQGKFAEGTKILFTGDKHATFGEILKSAGAYGGMYATGMTLYEILTQNESHDGGFEFLGNSQSAGIFRLLTPSELFANYRDFVLFGAIWPILWEIFGDNNLTNSSIQEENSAESEKTITPISDKKQDTTHNTTSQGTIEVNKGKNDKNQIGGLSDIDNDEQLPS